MPTNQRDIDGINCRLLAELQGDARLTLAELGRRVDLSPPAVAERLGRLEEEGVIAGYVVRDARLAHQYGRLLYSDLANPAIHSLVPSDQGALDDRFTGISVPEGNVDSFGQARNGVLYVVSHSGPIYRLDP